MVTKVTQTISYSNLPLECSNFFPSAIYLIMIQAIILVPWGPGPRCWAGRTGDLEVGHAHKYWIKTSNF